VFGAFVAVSVLCILLLGPYVYRPGGITMAAPTER